MNINVFRQIGGLVWRVRSPIYYELPFGNIVLRRDVQGWYISASDGTDTLHYPVASRDEGSRWLEAVIGRAA